MSGKGLRFWLAALAAPLLLSSCASYYKVEVRGLGADYDRSVFLIVCDEPVVEPADGEEKEDWVRLTTKDRIGKYLLYAQFDAPAGEALVWQQENLINKMPNMLSLERSEKGDILTVTINKALQEDVRQFRAIVLTISKDGEWLEEHADYATISGRDALRLKMGEKYFERADIPADPNAATPTLKL